MKLKALHTRMSVCLVVLTILALTLAPYSTAAFRNIREGMLVPSVTGVDLDTGKQVSSDIMVQKNLVIIMFWASWSQRSIDELKDLKEIYRRFSDQPVKIIAVNVEGQTVTAAAKTRVEKLVAELDLPFPVVMDQGLEIFSQYGVIAVPSTAIVDTTGTLRYGPAGYSLTTHDLIIDSIEVLMGLKQASVETIVFEGYRPTNDASRYYGMALNQTNRRQYKRALTNLDAAIEADAKFASPNLLRGDIFLHLDSSVAAAEAFAKAAELDSGSVAAWAGWGQAFLAQGMTDSAYEKLAHALTVDASYTPAVLNLGLCLSEQGKVDDARDSLNKARDLNQMDPMVHYYLGQVHIQANDTAAAAEAYKTALTLFYPAR